MSNPDLISLIHEDHLALRMILLLISACTTNEQSLTTRDICIRSIEGDES